MQEAILQAILAEPGADVHRLAYADWCEENDQPERAEFIRLQMALEAPVAILPGNGGLALPSRMMQVKTALPQPGQIVRLGDVDGEKASGVKGSLLALLGYYFRIWFYDWLNPALTFAERRSLVKTEEGIDLVIHRGWVDEVRTTSRFFIENAGRLFANQPITTVGLSDVPYVQPPDERGYTWEVGTGYGQLPQPLFDLLSPRPAGMVYGQGQEGHQKALAALQRACVAYGRTQAKNMRTHALAGG